jgi:hypothetical protein
LARDNQKPSRPRLDDLRFIAEVMDSHFRGPYGYRFGWDAILGLVPVIGDLVTDIISFYVILRAAVLGCPASVILRMGINVLVENIVDLIPFAGAIFDFFWKANTRNMLLLDRYFDNPQAVRRGSRFFVAFAIILVILLLLACVAGSVMLLIYLVRMIPWKL